MTFRFSGSKFGLFDLTHFRLLQLDSFRFSAEKRLLYCGGWLQARGERGGAYFISVAFYQHFRLIEIISLLVRLYPIVVDFNPKTLA